MEWFETQPGKRIELRRNLRNASAIYAEMRIFNPALAPLAEDSVAPRGSVDFHGTIKGRTEDERAAKEAKKLLDVLRKYIQREHVHADDILIISCRTQEMSKLFHLHKVAAINPELRRAFPFQQLSADLHPGLVKVTTIQAAQGLESDIVILAELDGLQTIRGNRANRIYTAISRARHRLEVLGTQQELLQAQT
jgi:superfamily I DNA and RNA helicase